MLVGLILGSLFVVFTEPPGLIFFNGLFAELPWGRWPLTIHSAAWGLAVNVAASLLVAIFTRRDAERERRDALHAIFRRDHRVDFGGRAARGAKWSLTLLWVFFALGPGAILGNTFFGHPIFTEANLSLGVPSLWVWQIFILDNRGHARLVVCLSQQAFDHRGDVSCRRIAELARRRRRT